MIRNLFKLKKKEFKDIYFIIKDYKEFIYNHLLKFNSIIFVF